MKSITASFYRGAVGALILYDITNEKSFNEAKKYFDFDDIKKFAEKTRLKLAQSQTVQTMQITYQYSDQSTRGNRMLSIDEELDLEDYRNRYGGDDSDIIGFTILLS